MKTLIYSCVFFNESYINLLSLLLISYKLFGNSSNNTDYLVICNSNFKSKVQAIFDSLMLNGKIWCLDLTTKFEAGYSRLKIFDYDEIHLYDKILYLDCDILVTNSINNILKLKLENKLYALKEGNTNHVFWGKQFFDNNISCDAFSSGILLFNNHTVIKNLFSEILIHINSHITKNLHIPECLDQPFIVYHAIKNNLYNNQTLINLVTNNPTDYNGQTISHFPGGPGHYQSKIVKMSIFLNNIMYKIDKNVSFNKIEINDYKNILHNNKTHFDKLCDICKETGENVEGNCFTEHLNIDKKIDVLIYKQLNHFSLGKNATNIMEIGFNAGHSSLLYLLSNPNSKLTIFDLCEHKYTLPCFEYLQSVFPDRLQIFPGDSTKTVPNFFNLNPNTRFDLIHIDGGHFGDIPNKDFYNSLKLASNIIIWDDTQINTLNDLLNEYINKGLVYEIFLYEKLYYKHRICRINPLINKKFKWCNSMITFLENGNMDAFGNGKYKFIDKYLVLCVFGNHQHLLRFNNDYSNFISVRQYDYDIVVGNNS
jgi:lipopolysaccharide biosynthesis glycosyltransferase